MTEGTKAAILAIRQTIADLQESSPGECLAGVAHELGFLIAFLSDRDEDADAIARLVDAAADEGGRAYREANEVAKNAN